MRQRIGGAGLAAALLMSVSTASAATLMSDDFERNTLNEFGTVWTGVGNDPSQTSALIVTDPKSALNRVLTFAASTLGGDAFSVNSKEFIALAGVTYTLSFDYLGSPVNTAGGGNGGFIGLSDGFPNNHTWIFGTNPAFLGGSLPLVLDPAAPASRVLVDDDKWHTYSVTFVSPVTKTLHVMIEDFSFVGGAQPRDAFFDNISVTVVPLPASAWAGLGLLGLLAAARVRRARAITA